MAFNGSGTFNRVHSWVDDKANSIPVTASRTDAEDDGFATGLSTCLTKDGQTTVTANLPMGGFRHTGVGNGAARNDYLAVGQYQDQGVIYATTTGSTNAYVLTLAPAITAYAAGQRFSFKASFTNTGAATLNVSTVGAQSLVKGVSTALVAGDIVSGQVYDAIYDGTNFQIDVQTNPVESLTIALSDEVSALTTGTAKVTWRMPYAFNLTGVRTSATTAPTGSGLVIDLNEGGTTVLSTKVTIDAGAKTSTTAGTPPVISDAALADDAEMTADIDAVGSTIAGTGAKITLIGNRV